MAADGGQHKNGGGGETGAEPQVRRGRKFDQVLAGARDVFMAQGFEGASVDDIAREASVSKATLYSYFPDKRLLFLEVCSAECLRQAELAVNTIDLTAPVRAVLTAAAEHFLAFLLSDIGRSMFRIAVAEAERFPELGKQFYESGPLVLRFTITEYLKAAHARGEVVIDDFDLAAEQFGEMCKCDIWLRHLLQISDAFSPEEKTRVIEGAVTTWLARYGA